jgi:alpha-tubulin suppressor-like RCC1 family protein
MRNIPDTGSDFLSFDLGYDFGLALKNDRSVIAWGEPGVRTSVPGGLDNTMAVVAGTSYSLCLRDDGTVLAWGGDLSWGQSPIPQPVARTLSGADGHKLAEIRVRRAYSCSFMGNSRCNSAKSPPRYIPGR